MRTSSPRLCQAVIKGNGNACTAPAKNASDFCGRHQSRDRPQCAICLDAIVSDAAARSLQKCSHTFHSKCLRAWLRRGTLSCPICRAPCIQELERVRGGLSHKIALLLKTMPPPPEAYFPPAVIGLLSSPSIQAVLGLCDDDLQTLIDVAYETGTQHAFLKATRNFFPGFLA